MQVLEKYLNLMCFIKIIEYKCKYSRNCTLVQNYLNTIVLEHNPAICKDILSKGTFGPANEFFQSRSQSSSLTNLKLVNKSNLNTKGC